MNPIDHSHRRLGTPLLLALAFCGLAQGARAEQPETDKCNPNLFAPPGEELGIFPDTLSGKPLRRGQTRRTRGTDTLLSPELIGETVYDATLNFSFSALGGAFLGIGPENTVSGTYQETIVASDTDGTCKQQAALTMTSGCIDRLRFHQYELLNKPVVADYRKDLPGEVASDFASRSLDGLTIEFHLKHKVCAPHTTRFLLLNTSIRRMKSVNALELITPEGVGSPPFSIHVPDPAP